MGWLLNVAISASRLVAVQAGTHGRSELGTLCGCGIQDKHIVATGQGGGPSALSASLVKALDSALHNAPLVGKSLPR